MTDQETVTKRSRTAHLAPYQFRPGQSGNPRGVLAAEEYLECLRTARDASPAAMRRLIELLASDDERIALIAAEKILDRAWGKARETPPETHPDPAMAEQRQAARAAMLRELAAMATPTPLYDGRARSGQVEIIETMPPPTRTAPTREPAFGRDIDSPARRERYMGDRDR